MAKQDYYELLGVARSSDAATVKQAYRKLVMECHPDRNPGDAEAAKQFKAVSEAYSVLSDHQKRQIYSEGAARFFGMDRLAEELGPGWDLKAPLESVGSIGGGPIQGSLGASSPIPSSV